MTNTNAIQNSLMRLLNNSIRLEDYSIDITVNCNCDGEILNYKIVIQNEKTEQYYGFVLPYSIDDKYTDACFKEDMIYKIANVLKKLDEMNAYNEIKNSRYTSLSVGDSFQFGTYAGKELFWKVIMKRGKHLMVVADDIIKYGAFDQDNSTNVWENCSLRKWLNTVFYSDAFSPGEKCIIDKRSVELSSGKKVRDYVFLLSEEEVYKWLPDKSDREATSWWWLRDSAHSCIEAKSVYTGASFYGVFGSIVSYQGGGIRPSLWINIK